MKNHYLLFISISYIFIFLFVSCTKSTSDSPAKAEAIIDYGTLKKQLANNLEWAPPSKPPNEVIIETTKNTNGLLSSCLVKENENKPICKAEEQAKYHLILGDLYFLEENYEAALKEYKYVILSRFESFEQENKTLATQLKKNEAEKYMDGPSPHLTAHETFYKAFVSLKNYIHYAEMCRAERRFSKALKLAKKEDEIDAALQRANLTLDKSIEYRKEYEKQKTLLLKQIEDLSGEYLSHKDAYKKHLQSWKAKVNIPKI